MVKNGGSAGVKFGAYYLSSPLASTGEWHPSNFVNDLLFASYHLLTESRVSLYASRKNLHQTNNSLLGYYALWRIKFFLTLWNDNEWSGELASDCGAPVFYSGAEVNCCILPWTFIPFIFRVHVMLFRGNKYLSFACWAM